ncbi:MAG: hypothetical protein QME64_10355, partial [bacterium]|nr:hypothetical protein [bacterium]
YLYQSNLYLGQMLIHTYGSITIHFFTGDAGELAFDLSKGWIDKGIMGYSYRSPEHTPGFPYPADVGPVLRINQNIPYDFHHIFTISTSEKNSLVGSGQYNYESDFYWTSWAGKPSPPQLLSPWNGQTLSNNTVTFWWSTGFWIISQCQIQVSSNPSFSSPEFNQILTGTNYTFTLGNGRWYWRVRMKSEYGV